MLSVGYRPATIPDEFLAAIGAVTIEFALLELQIESVIWSLLGLTTLENQVMGLTITVDLPFRARLNLFKTFVQLRFPSYEELGLKGLIAAMRAAEKERNLIVHSVWDISQEESKILRIKTTAQGKIPSTKFTTLSASDIRAIAARIRGATGGLINFHSTFSSNPILEPPADDHDDARLKKPRDRRKP